MALVKPLKGIRPTFGSKCWLADNATIIGQVSMGSNCSVWFGAVIRGDVNSISIGNDTNIQDGAVIHCTYQKTITTIGNGVSIAHNAIVHGCTVNDNVLIGMGAIVMDGAIVESNVIVAAGAIVLQNQLLVSGYIYAGQPAKKLKALSEDQATVFTRTAQNYILYSSWLAAEEDSAGNYYTEVTV